MKHNLLLSLIISVFLYSCNKEEDHYFEEESFTWEQDGEFVLQNNFQIETNDNFGRFSEGDLIEIDKHTVLSVYTRFDEGYFDHTSASIVSRKSYDGGITWSDERVIVNNNDKILNVMSASLLRLNDGSIGLIYLIKESIVNCYPVICISNDNGESFSTPVPIIESGKGYNTLNNSRVIKLSSGRIVVPISEFENDGNQLTSIKGKIFYMFSDDDGRSWEKSEYFKPCEDDVTEQEPGMIELKDGSLLVYVRTNKGSQYFSRSYDMGKTWTDFYESSLQSPLSPATIIQINEGLKPLVAVWNNSTIERKPLTISLSYDNGITWINKYSIRTESFSSYPAVLILEDGELLISYCYSTTYWTGLQNYCIAKYKYVEY